VKILSEIETRVLGSLVEKELTTPDYYPLSLNALVNACNQKSNRDPVMNLNEDAVRQALRSLDKEGLAGPADGMDNRVTKFEHRLQETFNFDRREIAILCELLLRGLSCFYEARRRPANSAAGPSACTGSTTWARCNRRCNAWLSASRPW
jgi:uncharacterized protein YceH (UPF0502 family)